MCVRVGVAVDNTATGVAVKAGPHAVSNERLKQSIKRMDFISIFSRPYSVLLLPKEREGGELHTFLGRVLFYLYVILGWLASLLSSGAITSLFV